MVFYYNVDFVMTEMKKYRRIVKKKLRNLPEGKLLVSKGKKRTQFFSVTYIDGKRKRKSITKNKSLIYNLAHRAYLEELLSRIETSIGILEKGIRDNANLDSVAILNSLPKNYEVLVREGIINPRIMFESYLKPNPSEEPNIMPITLKTNLQAISEQYIKRGIRNLTAEKWFILPYAANTTFLESKRIISKVGLRTRSKSEALILDLYDEKKIFYHYDETVMINGTMVSPDIIGLTDEGEFFIHEHAGLWSDEYIKHNRIKINRYEEAGFVLGKNLIISFDDESGNINLKLISEMIDDVYHRKIVKK